MTSDESSSAGDDDDFQRWYFGGSPPENDGWERHAFETALQGTSTLESTVDRLEPALQGDRARSHHAEQHGGFALA